MPEIPDSLIPKEARAKDPEDLIRWRTIAYRTVAVWSGVVLVVTVVVLLVLFPEWRAALAGGLFPAEHKAAPTQAGTAARPGPGSASC